MAQEDGKGWGTKFMTTDSQIARKRRLELNANGDVRVSRIQIMARMHEVLDHEFCIERDEGVELSCLKCL